LWLTDDWIGTAADWPFVMGRRIYYHVEPVAMVEEKELAFSFVTVGTDGFAESEGGYVELSVASDANKTAV
jgi:hypothetical protein